MEFQKLLKIEDRQRNMGAIKGKIILQMQKYQVVKNTSTMPNGNSLLPSFPKCSWHSAGQEGGKKPHYSHATKQK